MLACEVGHPVSVDRLVDGVGESAACGAVTTVKTYVFHLREVLEPHRARGSPATVLETVPGGYRFRSVPPGVDATRFEELLAAGDAPLARGRPSSVEAYDEALSLWRGEALTDLSDCSFVAPIRARLDELRASALQSRIQAELDLGRHLAVVAELGVLIADTPCARASMPSASSRCTVRAGSRTRSPPTASCAPSWTGARASSPVRRCASSTTGCSPRIRRWPGSPPHRRSRPRRPVRPDRTDGRDARVQSPPARPPAHPALGALAMTLAVVALLLGGATIPQAWEAPAAAATLPANSVSVLDGSGGFVASVPVGTDPIAVASSRGCDLGRQRGRRHGLPR